MPYTLIMHKTWLIGLQRIMIDCMVTVNWSRWSFPFIIIYDYSCFSFQQWEKNHNDIFCVLLLVLRQGLVAAYKIIYKVGTEVAGPMEKSNFCAKYSAYIICKNHTTHNLEMNWQFLGAVLVNIYLGINDYVYTMCSESANISNQPDFIQGFVRAQDQLSTSRSIIVLF